MKKKTKRKKRSRAGPFKKGELQFSGSLDERNDY
jgi:hypothetical protein